MTENGCLYQERVARHGTPWYTWNRFLNEPLENVIAVLYYNRQPRFMLILHKALATNAGIRANRLPAGRQGFKHKATVR